MTERRAGEAFEMDVRLTVRGRRLAVGDPAPDYDAALAVARGLAR